MGIEKMKCSIISGAPNCDTDFLKNNVDIKSLIICADSGYKHCLDADIKPDIVIGDFDSSPEPDGINCIKLPSAKDDTDTFYTVKYAIEKGCNELEIFNAVGNRFDHTYSNMICLYYCIKHNIKASIIDRQNKLVMVDKKIIINDSVYKYFSLFALGGDVIGLTIKNAVYELKNVNLSPFDQYTQSNTFKGCDVEISFLDGNLLLIQSND